MKRFLKRIIEYLLLFLFISFIISCILYSFHVDYNDYHKNTIISQKLDTIKSKNYNIIALGSSITFRQFNPYVFDSLVLNSHSYNAGVPALVPFRLFDFIQAAINLDTSDFDLIFLEVSYLDGIRSNYDKSTYHYSINFSRYIIAFLYPFQINSGYRTYPLNYSKLFFYKYLGFGVANHIRMLLNIKSYGNLIPPFALPLNNSINGFVCLDSMLNDNNIEQRDYYRNMRSQFLSSEWNNSSNLMNYFQPIETINCSSSDLYSKEFIKVLSELSKHTRNLILIFPPRSLTSKRMAYLKHELLATNYIIWDFTDPKEYPILYQKEYSFDRYHLNGKGAEVYTFLLADKYNRMKANLITDCN